MRNTNYNTVDPKTGSNNYNGPSKIVPSDHSHMPPRTDAYLPGDERGHIQASSLSGANTVFNVVPQNTDVNHGGYYSMERGERRVIQDSAEVHSNKTAFVSNQPGMRADAFMVTDTVSYPNGHTETLHHSFANEYYTNQDARNEQSVTVKDTFESANPGDNLRTSMSTQEYSSLMEETDASLLNIRDEYTPDDFSGVASAEAWDADIASNSSIPAEADGSVSADTGAAEADVDEASPNPD